MYEAQASATFDPKRDLPTATRAKLEEFALVRRSGRAGNSLETAYM
jgi:hypothetical protein